MKYGRTWNCSLVIGLVLSGIPLLLVWPGNATDALFLPTIGVALMFMYAYKNWRLLQRRAVLAWSLALLVIPLPLVATTYFLESNQHPWSPTSAAVVMGCGLAAAVAIAAVLAAVAQRGATNGWFSKFLRAIDPKGSG